MTLLVTVLTTVTTASAADVIELTFAGRGDATTAESVTVTNLTHPDIAPVTLSGSATLRLIDVAAAMRKGDVNIDNQVGIGDIVAITNVMAGTDTDTGLKTRSDVNGDGEVGIGDIVAITNLMAGNFDVSSDGAVTMQYSMGDLLRFDGTSDGMRTIMHLSPDSSHPVTFDFFRCQDKDGYNYPIVRAGDMLWMLEDLHAVSMPGIIRTSDPGVWSYVDNLGAGVFEADGKAYYTTKAARMALPAGWEMPSIDEMYAFMKDMNGDAKNFGDILKDHSYNWPMMLKEDIDSIHLNLMANGYIKPNGVKEGAKGTGAWLTRNTIEHGRPVTFEISATDSCFKPMVVHDMRSAFNVRGCRPAPSAYQEMLQKKFRADTLSAVASPKKMPMQLVNDNGPLGNYYSYGSERYSVFFDYSAWVDTRDEAPQCEQRSGIIYKTNDSSGWNADGKQLVPLDVNGAKRDNHLRKVAAQGNADGYENVVYASWSRPFRVHFTADNKYTDTPAVAGDGTVYITIFGDSTKSHGMLSNYTKKALLNADGTPYEWEMKKGYTTAHWRVQPGTNSSFKDATYLSDFWYQFYARAFNLNCIQDMTGDGVEEIVMNVADKLAIFDGSTLRCLREQSYRGADNLLNGWANLRFDVADVNGDGIEDIVVVAYTAIFQTTVYVYDKGHINEDPIFTKFIGVPGWFCDVKAGYLSDSETPEIVVLTRGQISPTDNNTASYGFLDVFRLYYNETTLKLQEIPILEQVRVDCFPTGAYRGKTGNLNLVIGYFRGRSYAPDLIVGDGLWRWDKGKPVYQFQMLPQTKNNFYGISADAIAAVQSSEHDGKETLVFFEDHYIYCGWTVPRSNTKLFESWLDADGKTVKSNATLCSTLFGWGNEQAVRYFTTERVTEYLAHPVLCKFSDRQRPKKFRYKGHEMTFTEPRIYAALAAAPYYADLGAGSANTTWGVTNSTTNTEVRSDTWGGSVIAGYEYDYSIPFLAKGGVEFTTTVSVSGSKSTGHSSTISYGNSSSADTDHKVVMQATPVDTYRYEIMDSDDPDEIGLEFIVSMPRKRAYVSLSLQDYMKLTASQRGIAKPQRYLTSTPGQPWTYPINYDVIKRYETKDYPYLKGMIDGVVAEQMVGSTGSDTRSISLGTSNSQSSSVSVDVEVELVATVNGVKAGVGFNYGNTNEWSHEISKEFTVEGTVPGLPSMDDDHKPFLWNLVWYYVKDEGGIYPVVNYVVMPNK